MMMLQRCMCAFSRNHACMPQEEGDATQLCWGVRGARQQSSSGAARCGDVCVLAAYTLSPSPTLAWLRKLTAF
jgi:hypothetical protein